MKKLIEKYLKKMFYKNIIKQSMQEMWILELRTYLTNKELLLIQESLKGINQKEIEELKKAEIDKKQDEIAKDCNMKIGIKKRIETIKDYIKNLK